MKRSVAQGFGLALLLTFVATTVVILASLELTLGPTLANSVGSSSQNNLIAKQIIQIGFDAVTADIQTKLNSLTTVDATYRYPGAWPAVQTVSIPTGPDLTGSKDIGNYYGTVTAVNGSVFQVQITATAGNATLSASKPFQILRTAKILDVVTGSAAAYSLRKLRAAYSGPAINVRRPSDNITQDIGFQTDGSLDIFSLQAFLGDTSPPLDTFGSAAAAYGLRKLKSTYTGYAINVRRSSDNTTQDIGFNYNGDLDTSALLDFVGASSGYVSTWYDQSGNSYNLTAPSASTQPRIVNGGKLEIQNNRPALYFDGSSLQVLKYASGSVIFSGKYLYAFAVAAMFPGSVYNRLLSIYRTGDNWFGTPDETHSSTSAAMIVRGGPFGQSNLISQRNGNNLASVNCFVPSTTSAYPSAPNYPPDSLFQTTSYYDGVNHHVRLDGTADTASSNSDVFNAHQIWVGEGPTNTSAQAWYGKISEIIVYNPASNVTFTASNISFVEKNQMQYFGITQEGVGYVTKWYDQSGNGMDLTQNTNNLQPTVVLYPKPGLGFYNNSNGLNRYVRNTAFNITGNKLTAIAAGNLFDTGASGVMNERILSGNANGASNDYNSGNTSADLISRYNGGTTLTAQRNGSSALSQATFMPDTPFQAASVFNGTSHTMYVNSTVGSSVASNGNFGINQIWVGNQVNNTFADRYWGVINEVILYTTNLSTPQLQAIAKAQRNYYGSP